MPMTRRKQQAIETKQKLLDAADALVKERGFDAVSVDDIVAVCGVAKGTFYHHFETKNDLLVYLTRSPYETLRRNFDATAGTPYLERLQLFIADWFAMLSQFNLHFAALYNRSDPSTEQQRLDGKVSRIDEGLAIVLECLRGATGSGELLQSTPVEDLSMALVFSMQGSAIYQNQHAETFDVAAWSRTFSALVFGVFLRPYLPGD